MTTRERTMALALGAVLLGVGGVLGFTQWFYKPLQQLNKTILDLQRENASKRTKKLEILNTRLDLEDRWNSRSLPQQTQHAALTYRAYLNRMVEMAGLVPDVSYTGPTSKARHTVLRFKIVITRGQFGKIVQLLENLERTPVAHRVTNLALLRADPRDGNVEVTATIHVEALSLAWAGDKDPVYKIVPDPDRQRVYSDVAKRDPFVGALKPPPPPPPPPVVKVEEPPPEEPPGPDVREFVRLTALNQYGVPGEPGYKETASLHNRYYGGAEILLDSRPTSVFSVFRIMNEDRSRALVKGKVLKIDTRGFYFQVGEDVYRMEAHESLARAMRRPLSDEELDEAKIKDRYDPKFAEQSKEEDRTNAKKGSKKKS
jgi:hypothetical protein